MATIPNEVLIWKFGGKSGNLTSQNNYSTNSGYNLFCETNKQYLTWGKQPIGINLVWSKEGTDKKVHIHLPDNKIREVLTGEPFAFGIGGGEAFLKYTERNIGINLAWQEKPFYEWYIMGASGNKGEKIVTGTPYAIVNSKVKPNPDFLIYLDRAPGQADVGWTTSPNWPGRIWDLKKYKEEAMMIVGML